MTDLNLVFPSKLVEVFTELNKPISELPILDLKNRQGGTDYIDFLTSEDMTFPIMRFVDKFRRNGIAFHLKGVANKTYNDSKDSLKSLDEIIRVLVIFQRYTPDSNSVGTITIWAKAWGDSNHTIEYIYNEFHYKNECSSSCVSCPFYNNNINYNLLRKIISNEDDLFKLYYD